jgi:hypothetical protein
MKLQNILISSLADFIRYFSFVEFWDKRKMFQNHLSPNKIFYWQQRQKNLYEIVKAWLDMEDGISKSFPFEMGATEIKKTDIVDGNVEIISTKDSIAKLKNINGISKYPYREIGILALYELIERQIEPEEINDTFSEIDYTSTVLKFPSGCNRVLPGIEIPVDEINITLKKILITDSKPRRTTLHVGNKSYTFDEEDFEDGKCCAWGTFIGDKCIEILPHKLLNTRFTIQLINNSQDQNLTDICVDDTVFNEHYIISNVKTFAITRNGYYYIDSFGKIDGDNETDPYHLAKQRDNLAYIKGNNSDVLVLLANGCLRYIMSSNNNPVEVENVISADFNKDGQIISILNK